MTPADQTSVVDVYAPSSISGLALRGGKGLRGSCMHMRVRRSGGPCGFK